MQRNDEEVTSINEVLMRIKGKTWKEISNSEELIFYYYDAILEFKNRYDEFKEGTPPFLIALYEEDKKIEYDLMGRY